MADYFIGEIRMFSFNYAPVGWAQCNGQSLPTKQNAALYSLLINQFGGDATNFNLPDLRSRTPFGATTTSPLLKTGDKGGSETIALTSAQIPSHNHAVYATTSAGDTLDPTGGIMAAASLTLSGAPAPSLYTSAVISSLVPLAAQVVTPTGGGQGHNNLQPYQTVDFCISLTGLYPQRQ